MLPEENRWLSLAVIPFAALDAPVPAAGSAWAANFGRVHYKEEIKDSSHRNRVRNRELSVWTGKINVSRNPGDGYFGEIVFE